MGETACLPQVEVEFQHGCGKLHPHVVFCIERTSVIHFIPAYLQNTASHRYAHGNKTSFFTATFHGPAEDGGFLWIVKVRSAHFLRRGSKAVVPMS
jgi:hypothetical protein